jgi:hypothetical protein
MAAQFTLAEAFVEFRGRGINTLGQQLGNVRRQASGAGGALARMAGAVRRLITGRTALLGGLSVGAAAVGMLKLASDAEEMSSMFDIVFGKSAKDAREWTINLATSLGRSRNALMQFMADVQDTFVPLGFAREDAAKLSKAVTKLGVDVASLKSSTVSEKEALSGMLSALVGNHEAVRKLGVIITETTLKQRLLKMGFKGNANEASNQQKVLARLAIIIDGTKDAQGNAAKTAGSLANQWKRFVGVARDLAVMLGKILMPAAKAVLSFLSDAMALARINIDGFRALGQEIGNFVRKLLDSDLAAIFKTMVINPRLGLAALFTQIKLWISQVGDWIWAKIGGVIKKLWAFIEHIMRRIKLGVVFAAAGAGAAGFASGKKGGELEALIREHFIRNLPEQIIASIKKGGKEWEKIAKKGDFFKVVPSEMTRQLKGEMRELAFAMNAAIGEAMAKIGGKGKAGVDLDIQAMFDALAGGAAAKEKKKKPQRFEFHAFDALANALQKAVSPKEDKALKVAREQLNIQKKILIGVNAGPRET